MPGQNIEQELKTLKQEALSILDQAGKNELNELINDDMTEKHMINWYISTLKTIISYQKLSERLVFKPLTVSLLKTKYWDQSTGPIKISMSINPNGIMGPMDNGYIYTEKDLDEPEDFFMQRFIPTGNLDMVEGDVEPGRSRVRTRLVPVPEA